MKRLGSAMRQYAIYAELLWRTSRRLTLTGAMVAIAGGLMPTLAIITSGALIGSIPETVRAGLDSAAGHRTLWWLAAFVGALLVGAAFQMLQDIIAPVLTARYLVTVQDIVARASLIPEHIDHLENPETARELAAVTTAMRDGGFLYGVGSTLNVIAQRMTAIGAAVVLATFHWWAPCLLIVGWLSVSWALNKWVVTIYDDLIEVTGTDRRRAEYLRTLLIQPPAAKEIRIFGLHSYLTQRFAERWLTAMNKVWRNRRGAFTPIGIAMAVMIVAHVIVIGFLGEQAYDSAISLGQLAAFVQAVKAHLAFGVIGDPQFELARATTLAKHVKDIETHQSAPTSHRPVSGDNGPVDIELRNVTFTYPARTEPTLNNLSLTIPAGQSIAIVGENGAGKSTLIKLLCGLYRPSAGQVLVSGVDLAGADLETVRNKVAVIFQDFVRYHVSLRENVGFGNLDGIDNADALHRALDDAGGTDLLERGWDTVLSAEYDGGTDLSGGQWQRIALARALAALDGGAGLLILDEPTAALDVRTETELFDRFLEVRRGATTVLVSHRLSSVRHADRIVVIADGHVVEDGSHTDLIALHGRYQHMFDLQARRFAETGSVDDA